MTTQEFLSYLSERDVRLRTDGDRLKYNAPKGVMTPDLRRQLADRKAEILEHLVEHGEIAAPTGPRLRPVPRTANLSLSSAQQRLWFLNRLYPQSPVYNLPIGFRMKGPLNSTVLEESLRATVQRHESLRTSFSTIDGRPVQIISTQAEFRLSSVDLEGLAPDQVSLEVDRLAKDEGKRIFDLENGPLIRAMLVRLNDLEHLLFVTLHHIISDKWSLEILSREVEIFYNARLAGKTPDLPELPVQYFDYACWQRESLDGPLLETQLAYWREQLGGTQGVLELQTDRPRPAIRTFLGGSHSFSLSKQVSDGLRTMSKLEGTSMFMTFLAGFKILLHRYTQGTDIIVGSPVANRSRSELEGLVGFFINTLALRTNLDGNPTFRELLGRVRDVALAAYTHQDLPFDRVVQELRPERHLADTPIIQAMFAYNNEPLPCPALQGLTVESLEVDTGTAKFDLTLTLSEDSGSIQGKFAYNADIFTTQTAERMAGHYEMLLEGAVRNPQTPVGELSILTEAERHQVVVEWNDTCSDFPREACVHQIFESVAAKFPKHVAVSFEGREVSFEELNTRANQLAHHLISLGTGPGKMVGISVERSPVMLVGLLAILKTGGTYVPLDPDYPEERLAFMLDDAYVDVLLTQESLLEQFSQLDAKTVCLDTDANLYSGEDTSNPKSDATAETIAYVIYTSGSTGKPKGVCVPHRAVNRLVMNTDYVKIEATDNIAQASNSTFDAATFEIWGTLLHGARLVFVSKDDILSPQTFQEKIEDNDISVMFMTTALVNQFAQAAPAAFSTMRCLMFGGEQVDPRSIRAILKAGPPERLLHVYGPTESTTFATWFEINEVAADAWAIPIGRPIANTQLFVLDPHRKPVPVGVPGELYIGGDGLAQGYLNRPELSAEHFVENPFSAEEDARLYKTGDSVRWLPTGNIEFLGRLDGQIKLRGFRIELGEIESVLLQQDGIKDAVVILCDAGCDDKRLAAYVVARDVAPSQEALKDFMHQKLPAYMVPLDIVFLEAIPLTPNGKVDREALPAPEGDRAGLESSFVAPRTETERTLASIWSEVLGVDPVGVEDNFFDLGGHSLLAVQLFVDIESNLGKKLPLTTLFQSPTVELLARAIVDEATSSQPPLFVPIQAGGHRPPFVWVHQVTGHTLNYYVLSNLLGADQPVFGIDAPENSFDEIESIAAHNIDVLRSHMPEGPYFLGGYCFGGLVAYEMAQQLVAAGEQVRILVLLEASPPLFEFSKMHWGLPMMLHILKSSPGWLAELAIDPSTQLIRLKKLFRRKFKKKLPLEERFNMEDFSQERKMQSEAHLRSIVRYCPQEYPGPIVLFRTKNLSLAHLDPTMGWGKLAKGGVEVHVVPGSHDAVDEILREPHVRVLAEKLKASLGRAESELANSELRAKS